VVFFALELLAVASSVTFQLVSPDKNCIIAISDSINLIVFDIWDFIQATTQTDYLIAVLDTIDRVLLTSIPLHDCYTGADFFSFGKDTELPLDREVMEYVYVSTAGIMAIGTSIYRITDAQYIEAVNGFLIDLLAFFRLIIDMAA
jgi:hypothetical protein